MAFLMHVVRIKGSLTQMRMAQWIHAVHFSKKVGTLITTVSRKHVVLRTRHVTPTVMVSGKPVVTLFSQRMKNVLNLILQPDLPRFAVMKLNSIHATPTVTALMTNVVMHIQGVLKAIVCMNVCLMVRAIQRKSVAGSVTSIIIPIQPLILTVVVSAVPTDICVGVWQEMIGLRKRILMAAVLEQQHVLILQIRITMGMVSAWNPKIISAVPAG